MDDLFAMEPIQLYRNDETTITMGPISNELVKTKKAISMK